MSQLTLVLVFIIVVVIVSRLLSGRNYRVRELWPVVIHYYPPQWLTPAQGGYLWDDKFDARDMMAALYDRSNRWLVKLEIQSWTWTKSDSIMFHQIRSGDRTFEGYEHTLWNRMRARGPSFSFDQLRTYGRESQDEFFDLIHLALDASCSAYYGPWPWYSWQSHALNQQWAQYYHHLLGYYQFIKTVESDKLQELVTQDPLFINKTLPRAVMFGLDTIFSHKLESIELMVGDQALLSQSNHITIQIIRDFISLVHMTFGSSRRASTSIWIDAINGALPSRD